MFGDTKDTLLPVDDHLIFGEEADHRFMPRLADKLHPLHDATKVKGQAIEWSPECQSAFLAAKSALATATLLHHPDSNAKTSITVDTSDRAVGGQLEQGIWCPVAFFSRKLSNAERKYSTFDRELLASKTLSPPH